MLKTVLFKVVAIINTRPIAIKYKSENNYISICPAYILFGRVHNRRPEYDEDIIQHDKCQGQGRA